MKHSRRRSSRFQKQTYTREETGSGFGLLVKEDNHGR
jgi:hypothetical protein